MSKVLKKIEEVSLTPRKIIESKNNDKKVLKTKISPTFKNVLKGGISLELMFREKTYHILYKNRKL